MVKEAYVSFEVAKLLKEKGFKEKVRALWIGTIHPYLSVSGIKEDDYNYGGTALCSAPTHQMACAWIRKKGYSIEVHATASGWNWEVCKVNGTSIAFGGTTPFIGENDGDIWGDYDKCMESALLYCLTNLI